MNGELDLKDEIDEQLAEGYQSIEGCIEENAAGRC